ncbi:MAG: hypothetical protein RRZ64_06465 [Rikenellaceae bacterium]
MRKCLSLLLLLLTAMSSLASENNPDSTSKRKKLVIDGLKLSGVVQVQWQCGEIKGGDAFAQRGKFDADSKNRMDIRRARFKMLYNYDFLTAAFQINASTTSVSLIEANVALATRSKVAALTTGVFYKPYGFLMQRSASIRMQPELPRITQTILPSDIGLGAYATFKGKEGTLLNKFKLDAGILTEDEFMNGSKGLRNFIGRLEFSHNINENTTLGAEFSAYFGGVRGTGDYRFNKDLTVYEIYTYPTDEMKTFNRNYYDLGLKLETKTAWGDTKIFGEYMMGSQPGYAETSQTQKGQGAIFNRKYLGGYIYFQQEIANTNLSFVTQFDYYDPNRETNARKIEESSFAHQDLVNTKYAKANGADMAYTTLGLGLYYKFCKNILAVSAYYDIVWNEKCDVIPEFKSNIKDNVFTLRLQCAF